MSNLLQFPVPTEQDRWEKRLRDQQKEVEEQRIEIEKLNDRLKNLDK